MSGLTKGQMIWVTQGTTQHAAYFLEEQGERKYIKWSSNSASEWIGPEVEVLGELPSRRRGTRPVYNESQLLNDSKPKPSQTPKATTKTGIRKSEGSTSSKRRSSDTKSRGRRGRTKGSKKSKKKRKEEVLTETDEEEQSAQVPERERPMRTKRARISYAEDDYYGGMISDNDEGTDMEWKSSAATVMNNKQEEEKDENFVVSSITATTMHPKGIAVAKKSQKDGWVSGRIVSEYGNFYRVTFNGIQDRVKKADVAQLVYDADITRYPIGTKVKKRTPDDSFYAGRVIDIENSLYQILYDDGSEELVGTSDMDEMVAASKGKRADLWASRAGSVAALDTSSREAQTAGQSTGSDGIPRNNNNMKITSAEARAGYSPPRERNETEIFATATVSVSKPEPDADYFAPVEAAELSKELDVKKVTAKGAIAAEGERDEYAAMDKAISIEKKDERVTKDANVPTDVFLQSEIDDVTGYPKPRISEPKAGAKDEVTQGTNPWQDPATVRADDQTSELPVPETMENGGTIPILDNHSELIPDAKTFTESHAGELDDQTSERPVPETMQNDGIVPILDNHSDLIADHAEELDDSALHDMSSEEKGDKIVPLDPPAESIVKDANTMTMDTSELKGSGCDTDAKEARSDNDITLAAAQDAPISDFDKGQSNTSYEVEGEAQEDVMICDGAASGVESSESSEKEDGPNISASPVSMSATDTLTRQEINPKPNGEKEAPDGEQGGPGGENGGPEKSSTASVVAGMTSTDRQKIFPEVVGRKGQTSLETHIESVEHRHVGKSVADLEKDEPSEGANAEPKSEGTGSSASKRGVQRASTSDSSEKGISETEKELPRDGDVQVGGDANQMDTKDSGSKGGERDIVQQQKEDSSDVLISFACARADPGKDSRSESAQSFRSDTGSGGSNEGISLDKSKLQGLVTAAESSILEEKKSPAQKRKLPVGGFTEAHRPVGSHAFGRSVPAETFASLANRNPHRRKSADPPGTSQTSMRASKHKDFYSEGYKPAQRAPGTYSMPLQASSQKMAPNSPKETTQPKVVFPEYRRKDDLATRKIAEALRRTARDEPTKAVPKRSSTPSSVPQKNSLESSSEAFPKASLKAMKPAHRKQQESPKAVPYRMQEEAENRKRVQWEMAAQRAQLAAVHTAARLGAVPWNAACAIGSHPARTNVPFKRKTPEDPLSKSQPVGQFVDARVNGSIVPGNRHSQFLEQKAAAAMQRHNDPSLYFSWNRPNASVGSLSAFHSQAMQNRRPNVTNSDQMAQRGAASPISSADRWQQHRAASSSYAATGGHLATGATGLNNTRAAMADVGRNKSRFSADPPARKGPR